MVLPGTGLAQDDWVRIGDGSGAEYRQVATAPVAETVLVAIALPLSRSHAPASTVDEHARVVDKGFTLPTALETGATQVVVQGATADVDALAAGVCVEIGPSTNGEYRFITEVTSVTVLDPANSSARLHLDSGLAFDHPAAEAVTSLDLSAAPVASATVELATSGSGLVFVDNRNGNFVTRTNLVRIGPARPRSAGSAPRRARYRTGGRSDHQATLSRPFSSPRHARWPTRPDDHRDAAGRADRRSGRSARSSSSTLPPPVTVTLAGIDPRPTRSR